MKNGCARVVLGGLLGTLSIAVFLFPITKEVESETPKVTLSSVYKPLYVQPYTQVLLTEVVPVSPPKLVTIQPVGYDSTESPRIITDEIINQRFVGLLSHIHWLVNNKDKNTSSGGNDSLTNQVDRLERQIFHLMDETSDDLSDLSEEFQEDLDSIDITNLTNPTVTGTLYVDGKLGVGTSSPADTLAVAGAIYLDSTTPATTVSRLYNTGGNLYWNGSLIAGGGVGNWTENAGDVYRSTGNVGIGTTSPYATLSVVGDAHITGTLSGATWNGAVIPDAYISDTITASNYLALSAWYATTTDALVEGSANLYWTDTRFDNRLSATTSLPSITTLANLSITESQISDITHYTSADFLTDFQSTTTDGLAEGTTNLYSQWGTIGSDVYYTGGNVGVGTISPTKLLHIASTSPVVNFENLTTGEHASIDFSGNSDFRIINGDLNNDINLETGRSLGFIMRNDATGSFATFATDAPGVEFTSSSAAQGFVNIFPDINQTGTASYIGLLLDSNEDGLGSGQSYLTDFRVGGVSKFNVTNTGNIGIGTTSPGSILDIASGGSVLGPRIISTNQSTGEEGGDLGTVGTVVKSLGFRYGSTVLNQDIGGIKLVNYNTSGTGWYGDTNRLDTGLTFTVSQNGSLLDALTITDKGNVGIGTTSPYVKLSVVGDVVASNFHATSTTADTNLHDTLYVDSSLGRVGVGTSNPNYLLSLYKDSLPTVDIDSSNGSDSSIRFSEGGNLRGRLYSKGADNSFRLYSNSSALYLNEDTAHDVIIAGGGGNVGIGTTSPYAKLSVVGETVSEYFTATGTTASTFAGGIKIGTTAGAAGTVVAIQQTAPSEGFRLYAPVPNDNYYLDLGVQTNGTLRFGGTYGSAFFMNDVMMNSDKDYNFGTSQQFSMTYNSASDSFSFEVDNQARRVAHFDSNDNFGIGTDTTPDAKLEVSAGGGLTDLLMLSSDDNNDGDLFVVKNGGNVGIGTTSPYTRLGVTGNVVVTGTITTAALNATSSISAPHFTATDASATSTYEGNISIGSGASYRINGSPVLAGSVSGGLIGFGNIFGSTGIAIGKENTSNSINSTAIGYYNSATNLAAAAIGSLNTASGSQSIAVGYDTTASADSSIAFGRGIINSISSSLMIGPSDLAKATILSTGEFQAPYFTATSTTATSTFGGDLRVNGRYMLGASPVIYGTTNYLGVGFSNTVGVSGVAVGINNTSNSTLSTAIGFNNQATNVVASAIGYINTATALNATAIGFANNATNTTASAIGSNNWSGGTYASAIGYANKAYANGSIAMGANITNTTANSLMIGPSNTAKLTILSSGNVGIGSSTPGYKLTVDGDVYATSFIDDGITVSAPDYVFDDPAYVHLSIEEIETFVQENYHLPWLTPRGPGAMSVSTRINEVLEALENLFLKVFELVKWNTEQDAEIESLRNENESLRNRLELIEEALQINTQPSSVATSQESNSDDSSDEGGGDNQSYTTNNSQQDGVGDQYEGEQAPIEEGVIVGDEDRDNQSDTTVEEYQLGEDDSNLNETESTEEAPEPTVDNTEPEVVEGGVSDDEASLIEVEVTENDESVE